jgi:hypothetical protein
MNPSIVNRSTFRLFVKGSTTPVGSTVTYDPATRNATLNPTNNLRRDAGYRAVISTGVKDLAGNAMAAEKIWSLIGRQTRTEARGVPRLQASGHCAGHS